MIAFVLTTVLVLVSPSGIPSGAPSSTPSGIRSGDLEEGRRYIAVGSFDSAVISLEAAFRVEPQSGEARDLLVHALRMRAAGDWRRNDLASALLDLSRAYQVEPGLRVLRQEFALTYGKLGEQLFSHSDTEAAIEAFHHALDLDSSRTDVKQALAQVFLIRGRAREADGQNLAAIADYRRALEVDSGFVEAHLLLGRIYYQREDFELARYHLREARQRTQTAVRGLDDLLARVDREYAATRSYATLEMGDFVVRFEGSPRQDLFYRVLPTLSDARLRAGRLFGRSATHPITVIIYAGDAITRAAQVPDWAAGIFDGKVRLREGEINRGPAYLDRVVRHEVAHAVLEDVIPGRASAWVHEGLAQYLEVERWDRLPNADVLLAAIRGHRTVPLSSLERPFATLPPGTDIVLAYAEAAAAIRYLGINHGDPTLSEMVTLLAAGRSVTQVIDSLTFMNMDQFQERVHDWVLWEFGRPY